MNEFSMKDAKNETSYIREGSASILTSFRKCNAIQKQNLHWLGKIEDKKKTDSNLILVILDFYGNQ